MQQFRACGFTLREEVNRIEINKGHVMQIEHDLLRAAFYLSV